MKTILLLAALLSLASAMGQEAQPRPDLTDPTVLALKALLPLKQQAKFGEFVLGQKQQAKFGEFLKARHPEAKFGGFLGKQKRMAMLSNKDVLLLLHTEAERPNYPGNAYAKSGGNLWLLIIQDGRASARMLAK